ncbi:MAG: tetratricopeptide repeat protein [Candidatus Omnitrophica bacterium]|nr:tetratricopeptide repeat protein [Candidatus Omnitrophota bacterium]
MYRKIIFLLLILTVVIVFSRFHTLLTIYYNNRGMDLLEKGEPDSAIEYFYKSLKINPNFVETHYNLAVAFEEKHNYGNAITEYKKVLELKPDFIKTRYNLALLYYQKLSLYEEAIAELDSLIASSPQYMKAKELREEIILDYSTFCLNSGLDYLEEDNFEQAEREFEKALLLKPDFVVVKYNLAFLYLKGGDKEHAKMKLNEVIQENKTYPFSYRLLGSIYFNEGNFLEALKYYEEVVKLLPSDVQAYNDLAQTHTKLEAYDKAIAEFQKALSLKPDNLTVLYGLASTYRDKGDYQNAIYYYKKLQSLCSDYPFLESDLSGIYATLDKGSQKQAPILGKEEKRYDMVYFRNGRTMRGEIVKEGEEDLLLKIKMGETEGTVRLLKKEIEKIERYRDGK